MNKSSELTENMVVILLISWLESNGCKRLEEPKLNNARGDDIKVMLPDGQNLIVECKGAVSRSGKMLSDWCNSAMAVFGAIKETEEKRPGDLHAIAIPDTTKYQTTMKPLDSFLERQGIVLFWVQQDGGVQVAGAATRLAAGLR